MSANRPRRRMIPTALVIIVGVLIMLSIFARIDNWRRDWTTNFARLEPESSDPDLRPLILKATPAETSQAIRTWADGQPRWQWLEAADEGNPLRIRLTRTTPLMRFVDDIEVRLYRHVDGTRLEAESQSRVGKGDLGQNPRNLKELVVGLRG